MAKKSKMNSLDVVEAQADSEDFIPTSDGAFRFDLKVSDRSQEMAIPPRMCFELDCGLSVDLPSNCSVGVIADKEWSEKGLVLMPNNTPGKKRLTVMAYNVGKQILAFSNSQKIGTFWFSAVQQIGVQVKLS